MALTRNDLVELVKRYRLQSPTKANVIMPDERIIGHLRRTELRIARRVAHEAFKATDTVDLESGPLTFPDSFLCDMQMFYAPSTTQRTRLIPYMAAQKDETDPMWRTISAAVPTGFVMDISLSSGSSPFQWYPYPNPTIDATDVIVRRWTAKPTEMTSRDSQSYINLLLPEFEETILPWGALASLTHLEGGSEDDQAAKFEQLFQAELAQYAGALSTLVVWESNQEDR